MKKSDYIQVIKKYKQEILQCSALAVTVVCACTMSYMAGRYSGRLNAPAAGSSEGGAVETTSQYIDLAPGSPSFLFPPGAACRDATPSNADMMDSQVLNLAYLYEDGADSTDPADSYAGRLYDLLALKDASWISGLYDLYNYTPQQLAALLGLPETAVTSTSGIIPEFRNISVHFVNSEQQETGSTSNAREIISIINTLHYFGILKDMKTMEDCADKLWNASHKYSVRIGGIYYCDGSCLDETADGRKDADESGTEAAGAEAVGAVIAGSEAAGAETVGAAVAGSEAAGAETAGAVIAGSQTAGAKAVEAAVAGSETTGVEAAAGAETAGAETVGTAAAGTEAVESGAAGGEPVGSMAASAAAEAETAAGASFSDASFIVSGASDTGPADSSRTCPGHVDCTVLAVVKGIAEADSLFQAADTLEAVKASGWTGWNADTRNMAGALLAQDWSRVYGLYTVDYPVKGLLNSQEIELYMSLVPEDASRQRKDFVRYALTSVGKIPYYWGGKPSAPGYTGNGFGSLTVPDEDGRLLKGLDCSGWINWVYWSVTGKGLGAQSTGTLLGCGSPVARDELLPGDICIRFNPMAHVVIFLGWTAEGNMLCIQETTGNSNNVEVGTVTSNWESYRRILE
ncbi:NlpC/P60 family protein [Enterocloster bolteae]|uniref:NlpC/P60 family protein n=1 Tax=Enterocloster bolteae TaxID=208479 RepID=UPI00210D1867|nr:NlpC/P60 family protein [Enterocloster bolteae]MCQ5141084.1 NlpC/P60 family protein [Enterocloster bolteae]